MNYEKLFRIYREERLVVRKRGGRKRALGTRAPAGVPQVTTNAGRWTSSRTRSRTGRRFRILAIVEDFTREWLALVADTSLPAHRVARELTMGSRRTSLQAGPPRAITRTDSSYERVPSRDKVTSRTVLTSSVGALGSRIEIQRFSEYYFAWSFPSRCETKLEAIACSFAGASFSMDNR